MTDNMKIKGRWIDRWLCSEADELLEREGATSRGIAIIDELNRAYRRSGLTARMVNAIVSEAQSIHAVTSNPVRILEIGMRDGNLLGEISKAAKCEQIPVDLHGVEFRPNLTALANERLSSQGLAIQSHYDASRRLDSFPSSDFNIVYSAFVLHHQSQEELKQLLSASFRVSRHVVLHLDLTRSLWVLALVWSFYTLFGYRASRQDAVLSCRRAYRPNEVATIMSKFGIGHDARVTRVLPLYWSLQENILGEEA
jgi:ubiquinone/menaquinone biosynthesis C-methylase UbiE